MLNTYHESRNAFVEKVAAEVLTELSEESKAYIRQHPKPYAYHYGLGLNIRNTYIYGKNLGFSSFDADELSSEIVAKSISELNSLI